ncbi:antibiotic biosynthesis monooxygenase [Mycobacterium sp. shizuoka-1]|uniref:antibiotic biosynthesis monooxygenase n=1 Tax=Mycobacterium sp. shizuoka-1 TaxID=2039281 RepID=UPI000C067E0E|nr:antibiotic biosynthesis monooxygenase [Mycobacterium sp. shizuoka-1]GAY14252.1 antibiotic biosynthesis monooxygenase [Mycobacterium sp. shizuoka-1]
MSAATVVTIFHPSQDSADFTAWAGELRATAAESTEFRISVLGNPHLDWGIAVTFASARALHHWLDSAARQRLLEVGRKRGILCATADMVIVEDGGVPAGVGFFRHTVAGDRIDEFVAAEAQLAELSARFSGFEGCCTFAPVTGGESFAVLRFRTEHQLVTWLESPERAAALGPLRQSLVREFSLVSSTTTFGSTVRTENGRTAVTPRWKTAMLILLVLYPTVMLLSRFLGPILDAHGAPPWLAMWLSQVVSVAVLQWVLMPWAGRWFRRWLDPIDGAATRTSVLGAGVLVVGYLITLGVFAAVRWLQYWDFSPT